MNSPFLYVLHSGNLYGTERMALATLEGLRDRHRPVLFAPPGPALEAARQAGMEAVSFRHARELARVLRPWIAGHRRLVFAATGVSHSLLFLAWNALYRRRCVHLHLVHGGTDERESYGRKRWLNGFGIVFVAVSEFVRERLIAHGVDAAAIRVCPNFLPDARIVDAPRRPPFAGAGIRRVILVSRVDPIKRIDLLLEALDRAPGLRGIRFDIHGTGWELETLRERAAREHPNVTFAGFSDRIPLEMARSDLLLHTCPVEPFGLAILEAMAAGLPVLVPDRGGAADLVVPDESGFRFRADDPSALAEALLMVTRLPAARLDQVAARARARLRERYAGATGLAPYRSLCAELPHD